MADTDWTAEELASIDRIPRYNPLDPANGGDAYSFGGDGYIDNQMRQTLDALIVARGARRMALSASSAAILAAQEAAGAMAERQAAQNAATDAYNSAQAAAGQVGLAAAQVALAAAQGQRLQGTSASNIAPSIAAKTFATQAGKAFDVGSTVLVQSRGNVDRWMTGRVTAYADTSLTLAVEAIGSVTSAAADWDIRVSGARGVQGLQGIPGIATMPYLSRSANTQVVAANSATFFDLTGTFTQTFDPCAALGAGSYFVFRNIGTGNIRLDPNGSQLIDGLATCMMYPGEVRLVQCDGSALRSIVLNPFHKEFLSSDVFEKPPGYSEFDLELVQGGQGGGGSAGSGGRAGQVFEERVSAASIAAGASVSVGAGGAGGSAGGSSGSDGGHSQIGSFSSASGPTGAAGGSGGGGTGSSGIKGPGGGGGGASTVSANGGRGGNGFYGTVSGGNAGVPNGTQGTQGSAGSSGKFGGGGGGAGTGSTSPYAGNVGSVGGFPGGGGGGGSNPGGGAPGYAGGRGGDGVVRVGGVI